MAGQSGGSARVTSGIICELALVCPSKGQRVREVEESEAIRRVRRFGKLTSAGRIARRSRASAAAIRAQGRAACRQRGLGSGENGGRGSRSIYRGGREERGGRRQHGKVGRWPAIAGRGGDRAGVRWGKELAGGAGWPAGEREREVGCAGWLSWSAAGSGASWAG